MFIGIRCGIQSLFTLGFTLNIDAIFVTASLGPVMNLSRTDSPRPASRELLPAKTTRASSGVLVPSSGQDSAVPAALQALADGLPSADWAHIKMLVTDVFVAAGHPPPCISRDTLPLLRELKTFAADYLKHMRQKGSSSLALMQRCVMSFVRLHPALELHQVKSEHVREWLAIQRKEALTSSSLAHRLWALKSMFRHAISLGYLAVNPCDGLLRGRPERGVTRGVMSDAQFSRLEAYLRGAGLADWLTACLCVRYGGFRLAVACRLVSGGLPDGMPVLGPLRAHLEPFEAGVALCPSLSHLPSCTLCVRFRDILAEAGLGDGAVTLGRRCYRLLSAESMRQAYLAEVAGSKLNKI